MEYKSRKSEIRNSKSEITLLAPAKINIGLLVKGKRPDGYHNIETIMVPIKVFDKLTIQKIDKGIRFKTNTREIPISEDNLVVKAAKLFFNRTQIKTGVAIKLFKKIPVGAGLGGGSSDAAFTLLSLNKLFKNILTFNQLKKIAIEIGMDVAFFLYQKPCYATGRGEILQPIKLPKLNIVLYIPDYSVSTKWAYQNIGVGLTDRDFSLKLLKKRLINNELVGVNALVVNTFENVVFNKHPDLLGVKNSFLVNGAYLVSLSGTGSAVFGVCNKHIVDKKRNKKILITESL